jgi:hypothetical protein
VKNGLGTKQSICIEVTRLNLIDNHLRFIKINSQM